MPDTRDRAHDERSPMEKGLTRREAVRFLALAGLVAGFGALPGCGSEADKYPSAMDSAEETPSFACNITAQILGESDANCCLSPASLYLALGLLTAGVEGATRDELLAVLQAEDAASLAKSCNDMMTELTFDGSLNEFQSDASLLFANSIWVNDAWKINEDYAATAKKNFKAQAKSIDFGASDASNKVSKWVSDHTNDLLKPQFQFTADTILALINTIYFKDSWVTPFEESATAEEDFKAKSGTVKAQFMHSTFEAPCAVYKECTIADMYFGSTGTYLRLMLPWEGTDPAQMMSDPKTVNALLNAFPENKTVNWSVPKFVIENEFDLNNALQTLGIKEAFLPSNDFQSMAQPAMDIDFDEGLGVSQVVQGTRISIDEKGAEAAAYTAIMVSKAAIAEPPEEMDFVLDRPFAYALMAYDNTPLFVGIVQDPSAK